MRKIIILICFISACVLFISCSKKGTKIETQNEKAENSVPLRIVSLSPAATEILFAISAQDKIVARTDLCDYPKEAEKIPSVGGFDGKLFSLENIISFKPDFVYLTAVMHTHLIEPLKSYGIRVYVSNAQSLDDILKEIEDIAEITGYKENGKICVENIRSEFLQAQREVKDLNLDKPLSVYWEVWSSPYMSVGSGSFLNELIQKAGLHNIFGEMPQAYPAVSEESIIALNPDIIIFPSDSNLSEVDFSNRNSWKNISAVKNNRIYCIDADLMTRPGPRIGKASLSLSELAKNAVEKR